MFNRTNHELRLDLKKRLRTAPPKAACWAERSVFFSSLMRPQRRANIALIEQSSKIGFKICRPIRLANSLPWAFSSMKYLYVCLSVCLSACPLGLARKLIHNCVTLCMSLTILTHQPAWSFKMFYFHSLVSVQIVANIVDFAFRLLLSSTSWFICITSLKLKQNKTSIENKHINNIRYGVLFSGSSGAIEGQTHLICFHWVKWRGVLHPLRMTWHFGRKLNWCRRPCNVVQIRGWDVSAVCIYKAAMQEPFIPP